MASRKLHNRSFSVVSQANSESMDVSDVTCFESHAEVTVRENPVLEQAEQNADIVVLSNDNVTISTCSNTEKGSMSTAQLEELLATLMQTIQSETGKQTAAFEAKLIAESNKQSAESARQTVALLDTMDSKLTSTIEKLKSELRYGSKKLAESLIARSESVNAAIRQEFNAKISSEISVISDKIETDWQGQEITATSSSVLASIKEHKEQMGVTVENLNRETSKSKGYVDSKFSTISGEIEDIKQHSSAEISRLGATLAELQA